MFGLKGRRDGFKFLLPNDFLVDEIQEKYAKILQEKHGYFVKPIDYLNETIQKIQVLGFNTGTYQQRQSSKGEPTLNENRINQNRFLHTSSDYSYRSEVSPLELIDKTFNVDFRHTLGFLNYFMLFENFWYLYCRDKDMQEEHQQFVINILNENGAIYCRVVLFDPLIDGIDMLDLDYTQPVAQSQTFRVVFKYSNIDFQFMDIED